MSDALTAAPGFREDPRIERTRDAVRRATLQVLAERGYAAFTVEAVAEAARVAKSTIYRHWPNRIDLIADALATLNVQPRRVEGEDARQTIEVLLLHLTEALSDSLVSACMPALIEAAAREPEVATFLHGYSATRRQALVDAIADGVASGELPDHLDPELASLALAGAVLYRRLVTAEPLPVERAGALVEQVLGPAP